MRHVRKDNSRQPPPGHTLDAAVCGLCRRRNQQKQWSLTWTTCVWIVSGLDTSSGRSSALTSQLLKPADILGDARFYSRIPAENRCPRPSILLIPFPQSSGHFMYGLYLDV